MQLDVLLPFRIFRSLTGVSSIIAETSEGCCQWLPQRLDCVTVLVPGLLRVSAAAGTSYFAIDSGVLVKSDQQVTISVRRAVTGADLTALEEAVRRDFLAVDQERLAVHVAIEKMQGELLRQVGMLRHA